jgi:hypothetical protein
MSTRLTKVVAGAAVALVFGAALVPSLGAGAQSPTDPTASPWKRYQLTGTHVYDIDALSATDAWAVGSDGLFAHWDGSNWNVVDNTDVNGAAAVQDVEMVASNQVWALSTGNVLKYDGTAWTNETDSFATTVNGISVVSPTYGWAAGASGSFARYDGTAWTPVAVSTSITETIYGLEVLSTADGWAVGGAPAPTGGTIQTEIARFDGTTWNSFATPVANRILYAVDMLDSSYGWAVGQGGTTLKWDGTAWMVVPPPSVCQLSCAAVTLSGVAAASPTEAWAVGSTNAWTSNVWHWNGTVWTEVTTPNSALPSDVTMLSASDGWIAGDRGTIFRYNGTTWNFVNSHWNSNGFYALDYLAPNEGWTVGVLNTSPPAKGLQRWTGSGWQEYDQPTNTGGPLRGVDYISPTDVWAVGSAAVFHFDGAGWTSTTSTGNFMQAMELVSPTDGWAVGTGGDIVHFNGTSWTNYTTPTTTNLWSLDMVDANEGWAGGTLGAMLRYQNGTWTQVTPNPGTTTIEDIHMVSANEGWAVGYGGKILHYLNGTWTETQSPTTGNLLGVYMVSATEGWAVGDMPSGAGRNDVSPILHYQNGTWSLVQSPTRLELRDVFILPDGSGWIVSASPGIKLHLDAGSGGTATPTSGAGTPTVGATNTAGATATPTATCTPVAATSLLLVPDWTNDRVMAFDPMNGNLINASFIPSDSVHLASPKSAILSAAGNTILVADQIRDAVQEYDRNGTFIRTFAPSGGPDPNIVDNMRGIALRPNGNLLVTVGSGANTNSVVEFDTAGDYIGQFIAAASGGLASPFDVFARTVATGTDYLVSGSTSDNVHRYDANGAYIADFGPAIEYPQQVNQAPGGNILVASFSGATSTGVWELLPDGTFVGRYGPITGNRGAYELGNGNILTTDDSGVYEINRQGQLVSTKITGVNAQYIERIELPAVPCPDPNATPSPTVPTTPTITRTPTHTRTPTATRTATLTRTPTLTRTATRTSTATATFTITPPATSTSQASATATLEVTASPTAPVTAIPTDTAVASSTSTPATPVVTATPTSCTLEFTDVPSTNTFYPFVRCLACQGIIQGYSDGTFRPNNPVTRGQISKIISLSAGFNEVVPPTQQSFEDVVPMSTFWEYVERLYTRSIIGGYQCGINPAEPCIPPDNRPYFRPNAGATRGQLVKIASESAGFTDVIPPGQYSFTDVEPGHTFWIYIERLLLNRPGAIAGYACGGPGEPCDSENRPYFRPNNGVTRGQASKIVANTFFPDCNPPRP